MRLEDYGPTSAITEADLLRGYRGVREIEDRDDEEPEPEPDPETEGREGWPEFNGAFSEAPIERW